MKLILGVLAAATLAGCTLDTGPKDINTDPATETFAASLGVDIPTMTKTQAGDYYKDIKVGTGDAIAGDAEVAFKYTGYIKDGRAFESESVALNSPTPATISGLIIGLRDGLQGMQRGGERLIVIPSDYGFATSTYTGSTGVTVPPNSTLIIDITLNDFAPVP